MTPSIRPTHARLSDLVLSITLVLVLLLGIPAYNAQAQETPSYYTVNGQTAAIEIQQMMFLAGLQPGAYYVDEVGDFGMIGQPPIMNIQGGPALGTGSGQPAETFAGMQTPQGGGSQGQQMPGGMGGGGAGQGGALVGARIFWVYSPSIFSGATGGASGYIHLCGGNVFYRSSEGSFSVGGDYNSEYGMNNSWAGGAHTAQSAGRWSVQGSSLVLQNSDGSTQTFAVASVAQGRWKIGQTKYAVERGRASCR